jgi:hypothetical protein
MSGQEWYNDAIAINEYSVDNQPEFLFISFPESVTKSECRAIDKLNKAMGYNTTKFYKGRTIMISFNK